MEKQDTTENKYVDTEIGTFTSEMKDFFQMNVMEFSKVEGNILSVSKGGDAQTLFFTSCRTGEGKTISSVSAAYALGNTSKHKVLLVDGNLQYPKLHELFNISSSYGLTDLIVSDVDYKQALRKTELENLFVIPCGVKVQNTLDVFRSNKFRELLYLFKQEFSFIIFDSHSVFASSDVTVAVKYFDGIIFVIEAEQTKWEVFSEAKKKIDFAGGDVIGAVLNKRKYYIPTWIYHNM